MSSKAAHFRAGAMLGLIAMPAVYYSTSNLVLAICAVAGSVLGSSLPDQLEIYWHTGGGLKKGWFARGYNEGVRHSIIPHRTITHWFVLWVCLSGYTILKTINDPTYPVNIFLLFLVLSGLIHVCMDANTRMGIPIIHPWRCTCRPFRRY